MNSLYVDTLNSGEEIPTCASYTRTDSGFFGLGCLNVYRSEAGGFQNLASYTGEIWISWVTYLIHAGTRSIRSPEGVIIEICTVSN